MKNEKNAEMIDAWILRRTFDIRIQTCQDSFGRWNKWFGKLVVIYYTMNFFSRPSDKKNFVISGKNQECAQNELFITVSQCRNTIYIYIT